MVNISLIQAIVIASIALIVGIVIGILICKYLESRRKKELFDSLYNPSLYMPEPDRPEYSLGGCEDASADADSFMAGDPSTDAPPPEGD